MTRRWHGILPPVVGDTIRGLLGVSGGNDDSQQIRFVPVIVIMTMFVAVTLAVRVLRPEPKPAPPAPDVFLLDVQDVNVHHETLPADSLFEFNKSDLKPGAAENIGRFVAEAKAMGNAQVMVIGYTDPLGTVEHNNALSLARAKTVSKVLVDAGVATAHVGAAGLGQNALVKKREDCPGADKDPKVRACLEPDRRVEIWMRDLDAPAAASAPAGAAST